MNLVKELQRYYAEKVSPSIENLPEGSVNGRFFIFKRDGLYHRVTVIKAWPNKTVILFLFFVLTFYNALFFFSTMSILLTKDSTALLERWI